MHTQAKLRPALAADFAAMLTIINEAACAYRGVIPEDCWHEPYMSADELSKELAAQVMFWVAELGGDVVGVMGIQRAANVDLIRHAYVRSDKQGVGIGSLLLEHLGGPSTGPMLIGTWAAAAWAIRFYQRHGFELAPSSTTASLLQTYWKISRRQIETSVVLARPTLTEDGALALMRGASA